MNESFNFEELIPRSGTDCYKFDFRKKLFDTDDVIPMWVADTDFKAPPKVIEAIQKRLDHGVFGYTFPGEGYYQSIVDWMKNRHGWTIKNEWIRFSPGVVPSLNLAVLAYTNPGDKIIIQSPVYFPFYTAIKDHGRELVTNPLKDNNGYYKMDLEDLKSKIDDKTKMIFLCSPHNPIGRVWKKEELLDLAAICREKDIIIISDEIHSDIIFSGYKHIPTAMLSPEISDITLTLMAPSKTFNIAGLATSFVISSNPDLLKKFSEKIDHLHIGHGNIFGLTASEAAYKHGGEWLDSLIDYFWGNIETARSFIEKEIPTIDMIVPEATYLIWLDFRKLGLSHKELKKLLIEKAGLGLSDGILFGREGSGFQRMNIGCPKEILFQALQQMKKAILEY